MRKVNDFYIGLLFECPFKKEMDYCPFKYIRQMEVKERIKHYYALQTNEYIDFHVKCLLRREGKKMTIKVNKINQNYQSRIIK